MFFTFNEPNYFLIYFSVSLLQLASLRCAKNNAFFTEQDKSIPKSCFCMAWLDSDFNDSKAPCRAAQANQWQKALGCDSTNVWDSNFHFAHVPFHKTPSMSCFVVCGDCVLSPRRHGCQPAHEKRKGLDQKWKNAELNRMNRRKTMEMYRNKPPWKLSTKGQFT